MNGVGEVSQRQLDRTGTEARFAGSFEEKAEEKAETVAEPRLATHDELLGVERDIELNQAAAVPEAKKRTKVLIPMHALSAM